MVAMGSLRLILKNSLKTTNQLAAGRLFACNHSTCTCVSFFSPAPDVPSAELPPSRRAEPTQSHCWTHLRVGSTHSSTRASCTHCDSGFDYSGVLPKRGEEFRHPLLQAFLPTSILFVMTRSFGKSKHRKDRMRSC